MKQMLAIKDSRLESLELKVQQHVSATIFPLVAINGYYKYGLLKLIGRKSNSIGTRPYERTKNELEIFVNGNGYNRQ